MDAFCFFEMVLCMSIWGCMMTDPCIEHCQKSSHKYYEEIVFTQDTPDYYAILEVSFDEHDDGIKKAYRRLALRVHPDKNNSGEATQRFQELSEAYQILSDSKKRFLYDQYRNFKQRK